MRITVIRVISVQITGLMIITAFGEPQQLNNNNNVGSVRDSIQNRFGFLKSVMNSEPSVFLPSQHFTSFLRPEEITGDEMKPILFGDLNKPNPGNTGNEYPDRTPESLTAAPLPHQKYSPHSPTTVFQLLKGQLSKSIPSIKAYLLTKELPFPKLNQLSFPLKLEVPITPQTVHQKHKHPIWSYLKPKSLSMHTDNDEHRPDPIMDQTKSPLYYLPKGQPFESQIIKEEPITLYLNKYAGPEPPESIKVSSESEHSDQPVYKETIGLAPKPVDNLDEIQSIQSQYNEQYAKYTNQIPTVNLNEFSSNPPAPQTSINDFYASPYLQNPHITVTRPFSPTWVPNAKKWYPGTHKSAFYPDTRIIKFTINDRIYNNSTKKPNYITLTTPKPTTTIKQPKLDTDETSN